MKRVTSLLLAGILESSILLATPYYVLQLRGGSQVYANDRPVRRGRLVLFHSCPDGAYMSLASAEVEKVVAVAEKPPKQPEKLAPGGMVFIGPALEGPSYQPSESAAQPSTPPSTDYGSGGYMGWGWGGYFPAPRPPRPGPSAPSNIGSNGFPILAPPGSPGATPPRIGPNGFPVIQPQP
ncbi:MAG: hypothetical protein ABI968_07985 [Acidobacteriota bacterium]